MKLFCVFLAIAAATETTAPSVTGTTAPGTADDTLVEEVTAPYVPTVELLPVEEVEVLVNVEENVDETVDETVDELVDDIPDRVPKSNSY